MKTEISFSSAFGRWNDVAVPLVGHTVSGEGGDLLWVLARLLEQRIRDRRMTFDEFVVYAETFARQHRKTGTLSLRHPNGWQRSDERRGAPIDMQAV
jgi:hypothetical protein